MGSRTPAEHSNLAVRNLHLWRGEKHLLRGVSFEVEPGQLLQIVGPNGVGKTSLLRCVAGLLPAESGDIEWRGRLNGAAFDLLHTELAYLAHLNALKSDLTARENLYYAIQVRRPVEETEILATLERLHIAHCADLPARALSAGQKRRVAIARVLLSQATVWILDEPTTNLDIEGQRVIERSLSEHLEAGGLIVAAAHQPLLAGSSRARTLELR